MLFPILAQSQVKSKLWYDGNARVIFNRDALEGTLKETDTVSTRSNGGGSTILDLGFHFHVQSCSIMLGFTGFSQITPTGERI